MRAGRGQVSVAPTRARPCRSPRQLPSDAPIVTVNLNSILFSQVVTTNDWVKVYCGAAVDVKVSGFTFSSSYRHGSPPR